MKSFLLRIEGVNLSNFVNNTQDLSTIRGSGLLLLHAPGKVRIFLDQAGCSCEAIVEGASIGLFRVWTNRSAGEVRAEVAKHLAEHLPYATFVVDINETENSSPTDIALTEARNRWRQMQSPTVVYPELKGVTVSTGVCEIDMVSPSSEGSQVSKSVDFRRDYGRQQKQRFYREEMERHGSAPPGVTDLDYAHDFDGICGDSDKWGNLRDKMAVIHVDGNGFGKVVGECAGGELQTLSETVRNEHARILRKLVEDRIEKNDTWMNAGKVRLETLLWGGDEITWVVPAWKGWEVLRFFLDEVGANPIRFKGRPLTYSAGLVFCNKKTPIHTVTHLAEQLTKLAKGKSENRFLYQALESFDHIVEPKNEGYANRLLPAEMMSTIEMAMPKWRELVSRKKLHRALKEPAITDEIRKELKAAGTTGSLEALQAMDAVGSEVCYHLTELWDYVAPEFEGGQA